MTRRDNNFNFLRILLATFVLLSHSSELIDGSRRREILTRIFGTYSLGELAVDGFFLLSGFLIVQSWERKPIFLDFMRKRILRIYPGFVVASLLSAFVVGPLGADSVRYFNQFQPLRFAISLVWLLPPIVPRVFEGTHYPDVNGSMWTIAYEFRCYMLVGLLGACGLIQRRFWLALTVLTLGISFAPSATENISFLGDEFLTGNTSKFVHLLTFFCAGGCFYLYREWIKYRSDWVLAATPVLILCLFRLTSAQFALPTLGAYILFWFAFRSASSLEFFKKSSDVSYGIYLYGWPNQMLLLWYIPTLPPWVVFPLSLLSSTVCGLLSWHLVERPFLQLKLRKRGRERMSRG